MDVDFKTSDLAQEQEAHLNLYNQMCHPAYAGAQADEKAKGECLKLRSRFIFYKNGQNSLTLVTLDHF
jgi:ribosomal protein L31